VDNPYRSPTTSTPTLPARPRLSCAPFFLAFAVIALGLLILIGSFLYSVVVIGIPPQDPPPEIVERRIFQYGIARVIAYLGIAVASAGVLTFGGACVWSLTRQRVRQAANIIQTD
jgi:hypothetical protein